MAPLITLPPPTLLRPLTLTPLTPTDFAPFGTAIQKPTIITSATAAATVNQGTAQKFPRIAPQTSNYPSSSPAAVQSLNLFSCAARVLPPSRVFAVTVLERHPFTSQTFVPLALGVTEETFFAVIVAPTGDDGWPVLSGMRAFRCRGDQAVTYAAGTWHAPMVVVGPPGRRVEFCVFNAENGVANEDLEEVLVGGEGVGVKMLEKEGNWGLWERARL